MCNNNNCTQSTPCNSCLPCDPCAAPTQPCCKVKIDSFKCITNAEITSTALGIQPDDTLDEVITKIIAYFGTLSGFYKGDTGPAGPQGPRGKRGCRGPAGTGDSIESTVNNGDGTVTITTVLGDVFTFSVSQPLIVENTLFVSKLGNDSTGERTRFDKHFLTIEAASNAMQRGDIVIVFPGTYLENNSPMFGPGSYYFHKGASVICPQTCFGDSVSNPRSYAVRGEGSFTANSVSGRGVFLLNTQSTIDIEVDYLEGNFDGITIVNCASIKIKGNTLKTNTQYLMTLRGNSNGKISFKNYDASATVFKQNHIYIQNITTGPLSKIEITNGVFVSDANSMSAFTIENCPNVTVVSDISIKGLNAPGVFGVYQDSAVFHFSGKIEDFEVSHNINNSFGDASAYLKNVLYKTKGIALLATSNSGTLTVILEDSDLIRTFDSGGEVIGLAQNSGVIKFLSTDSRIINKNTAATSFGILLSTATGAPLNVQISNSEIHTLGHNSIESGTATDVYLLTNLLASNTMSTNITNLVTTTGVDITKIEPIMIDL